MQDHILAQEYSTMRTQDGGQKRSRWVTSYMLANGYAVVKKAKGKKVQQRNIACFVNTYCLICCTV